MKKYRRAISALVLRPASVCSPDGRGVLYEILLVHKPRKHDAWQLPQGGIEKGESNEVAARRELMEETGLTVGELLTMSDLVYTYDFPPAFVAQHKPINNGQTLYFAAFLAAPEATVQVDKNEIDRHVWVLPDRVRDYIKRPEYAECIDKVYAEAVKKLSSQDHVAA